VIVRNFFKFLSHTKSGPEGQGHQSYSFIADKIFYDPYSALILQSISCFLQKAAPNKIANNFIFYYNNIFKKIL